VNGRAVKPVRIAGVNSANSDPSRNEVRIVFVDDESSILQAMRRTLHSMRSEWEMEFFSSADSALAGLAGLASLASLASLAKSAADVIVSDMRMREMDGWELLAEVKKRHPETVRLLLSGYADPSSIMRSVGTAHQYMAKPCDSATTQPV
jgi:response regulator RpfG family c-di-GMP phosphodiesterase